MFLFLKDVGVYYNVMNIAYKYGLITFKGIYFNLIFIEGILCITKEMYNAAQSNFRCSHLQPGKIQFFSCTVYDIKICMYYNMHFQKFVHLRDKLYILLQPEYYANNFLHMWSRTNI